VAANTGDLIQIIDQQSYLGQTVLNVYYYRYFLVAPSVGAYLEEVLTNFEEDILPPIRAIQSSLLVHEVLEARNLSNGLDIATSNPDLAGTRTGTTDSSMASFMSYGFQLVRESLATRNGYKRFAGLLEPDLQGNISTIAPALLDAVEVALAGQIFLGAVEAFSPVIYRRSVPPPVGTTYTYSEVGSAVYKGVGTQNTRKPGRGI